MALRVHVFSDGVWDMGILAGCRTEECLIYSISSETPQHLYQESRRSSCNGINCESGLFEWWCDSRLSVPHLLTRTVPVNLTLTAPLGRFIGSSIAVIHGMTDSAGLPGILEKL
jgi:hypothetical protein